MIRLARVPMDSVEDVKSAIQGAINLEFATIPIYLYAKFSILDGANSQATSLIDSVVGEEMIHMCLACNLLNAIGGAPQITSPTFPGYLPGDVAKDTKFHLLPFTPDAMAQAMLIEEPVEAISVNKGVAEADLSLTIGEYYTAIRDALKALDRAGKITWTGANQISDNQFFAGQLFPITDIDTASAAIEIIVSEGEGTPQYPGNPGSPLDFQNELAHYYRFWEIAKNQVLEVADDGDGYRWGETLGVDWQSVYPAIPDPETYDFTHEPQAARDAQDACNRAYSAMIDALASAFNGQPDYLGLAVRHMFQLRMAAKVALTTPLNSGQIAGPAFVYFPNN
jgi:Ferritin-like